MNSATLRPLVAAIQELTKEICELRQTVGENSGGQVREWHSANSDAYHNRTDCPFGDRIHRVHRRLGTGGKRLCGFCRDLAER